MNSDVEGFEILAINVMKVIENIEGTETVCNVSGSNCKCGHTDEIPNLKSKISFLENKFLESEANKNNDRQGPS